MPKPTLPPLPAHFAPSFPAHHAAQFELPKAKILEMGGGITHGHLHPGNGGIGGGDNGRQSHQRNDSGVTTLVGTPSPTFALAPAGFGGSPGSSHGREWDDGGGWHGNLGNSPYLSGPASPARAEVEGRNRVAELEGGDRPAAEVPGDSVWRG